MGEEGDVLHRGNGFVRAGFAVKQFIDNAAFDQVFFDQFGDVGRLQADVDDAFRVNHHDGAQRAESVAAGFDHFDLFGQFSFDQFFQKGIFDAEAAGSLAARSAANQYV